MKRFVANCLINIINLKKDFFFKKVVLIFYPFNTLLINKILPIQKSKLNIFLVPPIYPILFIH